MLTLIIALSHRSRRIAARQPLATLAGFRRSAIRGQFRILRDNPPVAVGLAAALLLFLLLTLRALNGLSANTDHPFLGYDYFGFPRCGLALRFGTNPFTAAETYTQYGPWATTWVTQPTACLAAIPISYLPPWTGFWLFNAANLLLHLGIIVIFGSRLASPGFFQQRRRDQARDLLFFLLLGLFFPWYVLYYEGQYHSFAVLALLLILAYPQHAENGFVLSALTKPVLGPAGLVLLLRRRWKAIAIIAVCVAAGYLPWLFLQYNITSGLHFGINKSFSFFLQNSVSDTRYSAYRWNQQISLSAALDEFASTFRHVYFRYALASVTIFVGAYLFNQRRIELGFIACTLWFFFLYARGHEYQETLYVPMLACLYTLRGGRYRSWWLVGITLLLALPTSYPLFKLLGHFPDAGVLSNDVMLHTNRALYYLFLWHKPLCAFLLLGLMLVMEWPYDRERNATAPSPVRQPREQRLPASVGARWDLAKETGG